MNALPVSMCITCMQNWVVSCHMEYGGQNPSPLQEQQVFLDAEPSLQIPVCLCVCVRTLTHGRTHMPVCAFP